MAPLLAALVLLTALLLTGCEGNDDQGDRPAARAVSGSAELERPSAGAPDAGTARGHGADAALASTSSNSFAFEGRVDPPDSKVSIVSDQTGRRGSVDMRPTGEFRARVTSLRTGLNRFLLTGSKPGHSDWTLEVRIVRSPRQEARNPRGARTPQDARNPRDGRNSQEASNPREARNPQEARTPPESELRRGRVEVPTVDRTVPLARLRVLRAAPSRAAFETSTGSRPARVELALGEPLRVTAMTSDPNGGAARARVSIRERTSCLNTVTGERESRLTLRYFPPAQTARAKVPPGVVLPRVESRTVRLRFTGDRCSGPWSPARSLVLLWADATNAHEMESSSAPVRLMLRG
jgi:hypothetical protein